MSEYNPAHGARRALSDQNVAILDIARTSPEVNRLMVLGFAYHLFGYTIALWVSVCL